MNAEDFLERCELRLKTLALRLTLLLYVVFIHRRKIQNWWLRRKLRHNWKTIARLEDQLVKRHVASEAGYYTKVKVGK